MGFARLTYSRSKFIFEFVNQKYDIYDRRGEYAVVYGRITARYNPIDHSRLFGPLDKTIIMYVSKPLKTTVAEFVRGGTLSPTDVCEAATVENGLERLKWAFSTGYPMLVSPAIPARTGTIEILEYIHDNSQKWILDEIRDICVAAAMYRNLGILKWMRHASYTIFYASIVFASRGGHLTTVKWLHKIGQSIDSLLDNTGDNVEMTAWLIANGEKINNYIFTSNASYGHINVLKWLYTIGCIITPDSQNQAAKYGHLGIIKWMADCGITPVNRLMTFAAESGNLELVIWLHQNECKWNNKAFAKAATFGHANLIEWAVNEGYLINDVSNIEKLAAVNGRTSVLKWIQENSQPLSPKICDICAEGGYLKTLKWIRSEGYTWSETTARILVESGFCDVLKWAIENGCPCDLEDCAKHASYTIECDSLLEVLRGAGLSPDSPRLREFAIQTDSVLLISWLQKYGACTDLQISVDNNCAHDYLYRNWELD